MHVCYTNIIMSEGSSGEDGLSPNKKDTPKTTGALSAEDAVSAYLQNPDTSDPRVAEALRGFFTEPRENTKPISPLTSPLNREDLRSDPLVQAHINGEGTALEEVIDYFAAVVPNEFVLHQFYRVLDPDTYTMIIEDPELKADFLSSPLKDTLGTRWNMRAKEDIHRARQNPGDKNNAAFLARFDSLKPAFLELNKVIVEGNDPSTVDWKNFRSGTPST